MNPRGSSISSEQPGDAFDLLVIGTGAAGMAAAIRGAELGGRIGIVESGTVGGTCVNVGCIPSKNLIAAAEHYHAARSGFAGMSACEPRVDWRELMGQKQRLVEALRQTKYADVLASTPAVEPIRGRARLREPGVVEVAGSSYRARNVVIATGTSPWTPCIPGLDGAEVLDSTTSMELVEPPDSLLVLGGSAVGLELGQMFARFGTHVTVLELLPHVLAGEDAEASRFLRRRLEDEGMEIHTGVNVTRAERSDEGLLLHADTASGPRSFRAQRLLVATGRRANVLGLEESGVELDGRGFIRVDAGMRTSRPGIFAAGDVTGGPGFVYVAAAGGRVAASNALGSVGEELDLRAVPRVTFTSPQIAAVGLTEEEAAERGTDAQVVRLELEHVPRARVEYRAAGWVKVVAERSSGRVLGVHAVAPNAGEMMGEATLAVRLGVTLGDLVETMHPYLTWVEALKLAAQSFTVDVSKLSCCA